MEAAYHDVIRRRLDVPLEEGPDKTTTLAEAVRRHVRAGDTVYVGAAHGRANVLVREVTRLWWGKRPDFTLAAIGVGSPWTALIHGGLVRRVITTFMGEGYPFPTPQPLLSRAVLEGRLEVQNWSMLTMPLRLLAGAMGVPFLTTKSLLGSSMEEDNARDGDFMAADDPFGGEGRVGYVRALVPDVALIHGWAADRAGNVLTAAPLNENLYGAMAARRGAVVTVERIVSTDFIRRHSGLVKLPSQYVQAVVEAPQGCHPGGMYGMGVAELEGYAEDLEWILECRRAFREPGTAEAWIREWILDVPDQAAYLAKLGYARIMETKGRAHTDAWVSELESLSATLPGPASPASPSEWMVVVAARVLAEKVRAHGYRSFLAGVGNSNLAAWLAAYELKRGGVDVEIMAETGMVGYLPRPAEPFVFSFRNFPSAKMLTDILHVMGVFMGGRHNACLGSLAAGQIDKHGNINSTIIPGVTYVTGSGGANDITSSSREVVVCLQQSPRRFVDKVPYITAPGRAVRAVVSDLGVYEKDGEGGTLQLTGTFGHRPEADAVEAARAACGWELAVGARLRRFEVPTADELALIRLFDPRRYFLGEDPGKTT
ncbi:MAG TPA: CoA-transferase [Methylomirabilota bacterium]|jgi:acyl CoA:acetate/3-ketoacid CoA transferase alpha subunit|nr:CoA-transferase [Methylomirabilota bacterium]